jgi:hypothetical protein
MQVSDFMKVRKFSGALAGAILASSLFVLAAGPSFAATGTVTTVHSAAAYGAEVSVGSTVKIGKVALAELPSCDTQSVGSSTASAGSVTESGLVNTGAVDSNASSTATSSTASSDVFGINLLDGVIKATEIKAVSTTSYNSSGVFQFSTAGTVVSGLSVLGLPISANVAPNTVIDLPLIGSVTLNEQTTYLSSDEASLTVNLIHIKITLGSSKGTDIIISSASSSIKSKSGPAVVGGYAYAPQLSAGLLSSGPLVLETVPCYGTSGAVETDSVAAVTIPGVVTTGTVTVTGMGNINKSLTESETTTSIAGVNVLAGLVSATAITGDAKATTTDGVTFDFTGENTFVGLVVAGHPEITVDVKRDTKVAIAGLGTLYLNSVTVFADKVRVIPIELVINAENSLGLPIGAELTLGAAEAQLHSTDVP